MKNNFKYVHDEASRKAIQSNTKELKIKNEGII